MHGRPGAIMAQKKRYIEEFNKLQMHFYNESKKFGSNRKPPDLLREEDLTYKNMPGKMPGMFSLSKKSCEDFF